MVEDTIVAQATATGKSGINIIRLSGKKSLAIAKQIFSCKEFNDNIKANFMYLGKINLGDVLDKGFCVYFKEPHSFTGEDVVEFQCHGGIAVSNKIINQCIKYGARLAEPGEYSKRAFLNGKMSLDQAEGIVDTINAESESQLKASNDLVNGHLYKKVKEQQDILTDILSEIEVNLDYPEHDIEYETKANIKDKLNNVLKEIQGLVVTEKNGKFIKQGINVAIIGKTNVGKSSLLNSLLNYDKAIVTDIEGTTRDVVVGSLEYKGYVFNFYDTAGIRQTADKIENIGIKKAKDLLETCDVILLVLDSSNELDAQDQENLKLIKNKKALIILNKCDLPQKTKFEGKSIKVSAKEKVNTEELKEKIFDLAIDNQFSGNNIVLTNTRHLEALKEADLQIKELLNTIDENSLDLVSLDVHMIWEKLGEITGESANEKIIDKIFSKFCLGK